MRGGSWNNNPANVRSANRNRNEPGNRNNNLGFRLAFVELNRKGGCLPAAPDTILSLPVQGKKSSTPASVSRPGAGEAGSKALAGDFS